MAGLSLHFQKPPQWARSVFVHYWNPRPQGNGTLWPGIRMTPDVHDWFSVVLPDVVAVDLVFTDGSGRQTGNLHRDRDGWHDAQGRWLDSAPAALTGDDAPSLARPTGTDTGFISHCRGGADRD